MLFDFFLVESDFGTWQKFGRYAYLPLKVEQRERERERENSNGINQCDRQPSPPIGHHPGKRRRKRDKTGCSLWFSAATVPLLVDDSRHASACLFPRARYALAGVRTMPRVFLSASHVQSGGKKSLAFAVAGWRRRIVRSVVRARDWQRTNDSNDATVTRDFGRR